MARKSTPIPPPDVAAFRHKLLRWFHRHGRDLPWRRTRNPYHILVSEFMLQQTQVSRVISYYARFLGRYPTIQALAEASPRMVRESWEGLGYYRRAANLHRLAREVVRDRAGRIPSDPRELRQLPGVGRYTAGAIASFAFERSTAAVDTNVARVLRRAFHPRIRASAATPGLWTTAEQVIPSRGKTAWAFNQAMMELGALICTAREARCGRCPVRLVCATGKARLTGPFNPASLRQRAQPGQTSRQSKPRSAGGRAARRSTERPRRSDPAERAGRRSGGQ